MKISDGSAVSISYDIRTADGRLIESSEKRGSPLNFVYVRGQRVMLPGLGSKLAGLEVGQETKFELKPEEAFGRVEDSPIKDIPRSEFPANAQIKEGMSFEAGLPGGQPIRLVVTKVTSEVVSSRMVHPLAGQSIKMRVKVLSVRAATDVEKASGLVAG